jgi:Bacterial protein of unknown function (DUF899)
MRLIARDPSARCRDGLRGHRGWEFPWYTLRDDFDADHDVGEWHGTNVFLGDGDEVYRTPPRAGRRPRPYTWGGWHDKHALTIRGTRR